MLLLAIFIVQDHVLHEFLMLQNRPCEMLHTTFVPNSWLT